MDMFDKLQALNEKDKMNGTKLFQISNILVRADKVKKGGHITMGVPEDVVLDMVSGKDVRVALLIIDGKEYDKL